VGIDSLMRPAVFLDRDGTLNEDVYYAATGEWEAPMRVDDVVLRPGVGAALRALKERGFALVVVSNQAAHAKGKTSLRALWQVHLRFARMLADEGAEPDDFFYSYSHPDGRVAAFSGPSLERKPGCYFLLVAAARHDLDLARSWMVGDRDTDVACGRAAGVRTIRIDNPRGHAADDPAPDFRARDLGDVAQFILAP
jgi:D-glycero-D-manno-heptose 1,7-bisphosphate phosphatase